MDKKEIDNSVSCDHEGDDVYDLISSCQHEDTEDGVCLNCGITISSTFDMTESYTKCHTLSQSNNNGSYEKEVESMTCISDNVKAHVMQEASTCEKKVNRATKRREKIFFHVYRALAARGEAIQPDQIVNELNMTKRNVNQALRFVSGTSSTPIRTNDGSTLLISPIVAISPVRYLQDIVDCLNVNGVILGPDHVEEIKGLFTDTLQRDPLLREEKPRNMAIGIIKYYCMKRGINIKGFHEKVKLSQPAIKTYMVKVENVFKT